MSVVFLWKPFAMNGLNKMWQIEPLYKKITQNQSKVYCVDYIIKPKTHKAN